MAETSKEAAASPKAPASSPPTEDIPAPVEQTSTEETAAGNPAEPAEDFHNPDHWATLNEGVREARNSWIHPLTARRKRQEMTMLIQQLEMMLPAQLSLFLRASFTTAPFMGERITLSGEMPSTGMEALSRVSSRADIDQDAER
jgi:hypothetical protein